MLKSEMQHQFWITKKAVQRKFSSKEDEHIISSDAELDAKIEIFKSISTTSMDLFRIIDQYQERLCILSQEESVFGRFLKEAGKRSKTTSETITSAGKAVSYCGQQRMCVRTPLLRLQHEVEVFRCRAISDMQNTIALMEKERTEYRAALEWMKSASSELDPDTGRGLDKFRTAQSHVRNAKQLFDTLTMNSIQKIDLLAAARCNMFSHVLVSYVSELRQFAEKTNATYEAISKALEGKPKYDFCILKELTHHESSQPNDKHIKTSFDKDQSLFFAEDYVDAESNISECMQRDYLSEPSNYNLVQVCEDSENILDMYDKHQNESFEKESTQIAKTFITNDSVSSQMTAILPEHSFTNHITVKESQCMENETTLEPPKDNKNKEIKTSKNLKKNMWMDLFADLDPLSNLDDFDLKLSADSKNFQQI